MSKVRLGMLGLPCKIELPNGEIYALGLMRIVSRDEKRRPEELVYIPQDRNVEVVSTDLFVTTYLPEKMA